MQRLAGVKNAGNDSNANKVRKIEKGDRLKVNVGSFSIGCIITERKSKQNTIKIELMQPVCTSIGEKVAISRSFNRKLRLIGWGNIIKGWT